MKKILSLNLFLILSVIISVVYYFSAFEHISEAVVRLHILPNSNSARDIDTKLSVRDAILFEMNSELDRNSGRAEIIRSAEKIETLANSYLARNGLGYSARARVETTHIPRKSYNGITMPAGEYTSIRVLLGNGTGENWWCVAYPPLCFTEEVFGKLSDEGKEQLRRSIGKQGCSIIDREIKYELKLVELAERAIRFIRQKGG